MRVERTHRIGGRGQTHHSQVGKQESTGAGGEDSQDEEEEAQTHYSQVGKQESTGAGGEDSQDEEEEAKPSQSGR